MALILEPAHTLGVHTVRNNMPDILRYLYEKSPHNNRKCG